MRSEHILVIDDNPDVRDVVVSTLLCAGYSVREARSGHEGLQMVIQQRPDLILCDVKMPALDGYQTLEAIRKCANTAAIPFIFITGSMGPTDFRRGMACGADDYLNKPFTADELISAVRTRLERRVDIQTDFFRRTGKPNISKVLNELRAVDFHSVSEIAATSTELPVFRLD